MLKRGLIALAVLLVAWSAVQLSSNRAAMSPLDEEVHDPSLTAAPLLDPATETVDPGELSVAPQQALEEPTSSPHAELSRQDITKENWVVALQSNGEPLQGDCVVLSLDPGLTSFYSGKTELTIAEAHAHSTAASFTGLSEFDLKGLPVGEYFCYISSEGHFSQGRYIQLPLLKSENQSWQLSRKAELKAFTRDIKGKAVPGVSVEFSSYAAASEWASWGWRERLGVGWYFETVESDKDGFAEPKSYPDAELRAKTISDARGFAPVKLNPVWHIDKKVYEFVMTVGVEIYGKIAIANQDPDAIIDCKVSVFKVEDGYPRTLGSADTFPDGSYRVSIGTDATSLVIMGAGDGVTSQVKRLPNVVVGGSYRLDFDIEEGLAFDAKLVDSLGGPVDGLQISFYENERDWVPFAYLSDEQGAFQTEATFLPDTSYEAHLFFQNMPLGAVSATTPNDPTKEWVVVVPDLCRPTGVTIESSRGTEVIRKFGFHATGQRKQMLYSWAAQDPPPWMPARPGTLLFRIEDGRVFEQPFHPGESHRQEAVIQLVQGTIQFTLPETPGGNDWGFALLTRAGFPVEQKMLGAGAHSIQAPEGEYSLNVRGADGSELFHGPFLLTESGMVFGTLAPCQWDSLAGQVVDSDGKPVAAVALRAVRSDGIAERTALSDAKGQFVFESMAAGVYRVEARPAENHAADYPNLVSEFRIPRLTNEPLLFQLPSIKQTISVELSPAPVRIAAIHAVASSAHATMRVHSSGVGKLPIDASHGDVFSFETRTDGVQVRHASFADGQDKVDLTLAGLLTRSLVVDPSETIRQVDFFFEQQHVGSAYPEGVLNEWSLKAPDLPNLEVSISFANSKTIRMPFRDLPMAGPLKASATWGNHIRVQSLDGRALSSAIVCSEDGSYRLSCNADGEANGEHIQLNQKLSITAMGYWPRLAMPSATIELHRDAKGADIRIAAGMGATRLEVRPAMDFGYAWAPSIIKNDDGVYEMRECPEGEYTLYAVSDAGELIAEKIVQLSALELVDLRVP